MADENHFRGFTKMIRLIDANALMDDVEMDGALYACLGAVDDVRFLVDSQPTVDAVEVVHGRWIWKDGKCFCSACSKQCEPKFVYQDGTVDEYPYCPNCGAKMDGDGND